MMDSQLSTQRSSFSTLANALREPPSLGSLSQSPPCGYSSGLTVDIRAPSQESSIPDWPPGNRQSGGITDPLHRQYSPTPSIHPSTTSYPFSAALLRTPPPGPTLGSFVSSISSETSMYSTSSGRDTAVASPIVQDVGAAAGQGSRSSRRHICLICEASFGQKKALNRHFGEKHLRWESCPLCSSFKWPRTRRYVFENHLHEKHHMSSLTPKSRGGRRHYL
jgi:hypothetical protein